MPLFWNVPGPHSLRGGVLGHLDEDMKSSRSQCNEQCCKECWGRKAPVLFLASLLLRVANAPQFSVPTPKCYIEHNPF